MLPGIAHGHMAAASVLLPIRAPVQPPGSAATALNSVGQQMQHDPPAAMKTPPRPELPLVLSLPLFGRTRPAKTAAKWPHALSYLFH